MASTTTDEISITLMNATTGTTEVMRISPANTPLQELKQFASALLSLNGNIRLTKDGQIVSDTKGLKDGDLILANRVPAPAAARRPPQPRAAGPPAAGGLDFSGLLSSAGGGGGGGGGGIDFSGLFGQPNTSAPSAQGQGGLDFSNLLSSSAAAAPSNNTQQTQQQNQAVEWDGINLDDAIARNPNPKILIPLILNTTKHANLFKELNYHNPVLASKIKKATEDEEGTKGVDKAVSIWREEMMKGSLKTVLRRNLETSKESEMTKRLRVNPMDEEANAFFGAKIAEQNVQNQYLEMMEQYPESMGRVLMLYIETQCNGHPIQAFVDSGAQSTIMSSDCADKCGLLHLLDTRFAGTAVGVGTGKILGRVHLAPLQIGKHFFPCTITVMDSSGEGLGDKNMDFLFGLDMLKRHRCKIDLESNSLVFALSDGYMTTPFLHEKDLNTTKGGTRDFNAEESNAEIQKILEKESAKENGDSKDDDMKEDDDTKAKSSDDANSKMDVDK